MCLLKGALFSTLILGPKKNFFFFLRRGAPSFGAHFASPLRKYRVSSDQIRLLLPKVMCQAKRAAHHAVNATLFAFPLTNIERREWPKK